MHSLARTVFLLYLSHLLTDFVFQTDTLVQQKKRGALSAYFWHGVVHYLAAVSLLGFFVPFSILTRRTQFVVLGLTVVHLVFDLTKAELTRRKIVSDGFWAYIFDQAAHLITVLVAAWLISPTVTFSEAALFIESIRNIPNRLLVVPVVYVAVVFGGGYLIRFVTKGLAHRAENNATAASSVSEEQLQNAGLYIGWLERFLVLTALLLHAPATVGLILTAKSIARYPEFETESFAEYFLIGTLLSLAIALLAGILLLELLFGKVQLFG
jgi:hypothetical protein